MENKGKPEIRFAEFTADWEQRFWVDTVDISTNMVDPKIEKFEDLPHIGPGNIESFTGRILDNVKRVKEDNLISGKFHFKAGDIIYAKINPQLGKYVLSEFEGLASADAYVLNTKNGLTQKFLFSILQGMDFYKYSVSVSMRTGMPKINRDELNQYNFFSPSLEEQGEIGEFFIQLDKTIALQQQELNTLKQTKQGFLQKMFPKEGESAPEVRFLGFTGDWKQRKLGDITETSSGGTPSVGNKSFYGGDIPFVRSAEINSESTELFITEEGLKNSSTTMVKKGDILYALYGATSGEVGISKINGAINQAVLVMRPNFSDDSYFIVQWLKKQKSRIINTFLQGGQGNLSGSIVRRLIITTPPSIDEQMKIGVFFKELDNKIALHEQELKTLKETKKAFLQKMFV